MILLFGSPRQASLRKISIELAKRKEDFSWIDVGNFRNSQWAHKFGGRKKRISICSSEVDINSISVVFTRGVGNMEFDNEPIDNELKTWLNKECRAYVQELLENLDCHWMPAKLTRLYNLEEKELTQLFKALDINLKLPDSLVTNNPDEAIEFYQKHSGKIISKRYRSSAISLRGEEYGYPTSLVSLRDITYFNNIKWSPVLFQEYVPKAKELRATLVGENIVTAEIDSQKTHRTWYDWRKYDLKRTPYKQHMLPKSIRDQLVLLAKHLKLNYATYDLILTPKGEYVFLECNPAGQYVWIEDEIGVNLTGLICDELASLSTQGRKKKTSAVSKS